MRVKWKKFERYTSSNQFSEQAGAGTLINFVYIGSVVVGVVNHGAKFVQVPIVYLETDGKDA